MSPGSFSSKGEYVLDGIGEGVDSDVGSDVGSGAKENGNLIKAGAAEAKPDLVSENETRSESN